MRITGVSVVLHDRRTDVLKVFGVSDGKLPLGVLRIETDEGIEGNDFISSPGPGPAAIADQIVTFLGPLLIGQDPLDIGVLWSRMHRLSRFVDPIAIGVVDVALWDIAGKVAGLPVHRLLGTCRDRVPAYASSGWLPSPEAYGGEAQHFQALGWTAYKIHPHGVPRDDIKICQAVRRAVGDDMVLMLDSMWCYGYEDAVRVGRAIEALNYFWYEDPLAEEDLYNCVKLRNKLDIPIMSTEYAHGRLYGMAQWIQQMASDILRGDVAVTGGMSPLATVAQ